MITFEEAIKELKISQDNLQRAQSEGGFQTVSLPDAVGLIGFLVKHPELGTTYREWNLLKDKDGEQHGFIAAEFNDETTKKFYPLAKGVKVVASECARKYGGTILEALKSSSPAPSHIEKELTPRLGQLSSALDADEMITPAEYTEFGQGARTALEIMSLCNDSDEVANYLQEIKTKSFKKIYKKINTDSGLCPLCGSKNISFTGSEWDHDKYYDDAECGDCGAKWTLNYKYAFKSCVADSNGTTIIPTNQEVSE